MDDATDESSLRHLLFIAHRLTGHRLYGLDGEKQCLTCGIDFTQDKLETIEEKVQHPSRTSEAIEP